MEMFLFRNFCLFLQLPNKSYAYSVKNNNDSSSLEVLCVSVSVFRISTEPENALKVHTLSISNSFLDLSKWKEENKAPGDEWWNVIVHRVYTVVIVVVVYCENSNAAFIFVLFTQRKREKDKEPKTDNISTNSFKIQRMTFVFELSSIHFQKLIKNKAIRKISEHAEQKSGLFFDTDSLFSGNGNGE